MTNEEKIQKNAKKSELNGIERFHGPIEERDYVTLIDKQWDELGRLLSIKEGYTHKLNEWGTLIELIKSGKYDSCLKDGLMTWNPTGAPGMNVPIFPSGVHRENVTDFVWTIKNWAAPKMPTRPFVSNFLCDFVFSKERKIKAVGEKAITGEAIKAAKELIAYLPSAKQTLACRSRRDVKFQFLYSFGLKKEAAREIFNVLNSESITVTREIKSVEEMARKGAEMRLKAAVEELVECGWLPAGVVDFNKEIPAEVIARLTQKSEQIVVEKQKKIRDLPQAAVLISFGEDNDDDDILNGETLAAEEVDEALAAELGLNEEESANKPVVKSSDNPTPDAVNALSWIKYAVEKVKKSSKEEAPALISAQPEFEKTIEAPTQYDMTDSCDDLEAETGNSEFASYTEEEMNNYVEWGLMSRDQVEKELKRRNS